MDDKDNKSQIEGRAEESAEEPAKPPRTTEAETVEKEADPLGRDPTRFGDWEKNGRCIDF